MTARPHIDRALRDHADADIAHGWPGHVIDAIAAGDDSGIDSLHGLQIGLELKAMVLALVETRRVNEPDCYGELRERGELWRGEAIVTLTQAVRDYADYLDSFALELDWEARNE